MIIMFLKSAIAEFFVGSSLQIQALNLELVLLVLHMLAYFGKHMSSSLTSLITDHNAVI